MRYEAWDLPTDAATFQRKIADIPVIEGTGTGYLVNGGGGGGEMAVPADFSRLSTIISATDGSLIRVYDGTTLVHEWITERVDHDIIDGEGVVRISGPDIQALLGKAVVYAYDYPKQPSLDPDWLWGHGRNLLGNPSFEDNPNGLANKGFEDGTLSPWRAGAVENVSATLNIETTTVDVGTYAAKCRPLIAEGGMSATISNLYPFADYTVTARVNGSNTVDYQIGASGALALVAYSPASVVVHSDGGQFAPGHDREAQLNFTGTGVYATQTLNFRTGFQQTFSQISVRENEAIFAAADFFVDDVTVTGYGIGMDPWLPTRQFGGAVSTFESSTDVTADDGTYTGKVTASPFHGIYQTVDNVIEGSIYSGSIRIRNASGSARWGLELRDNRGVLIDQASVVTSTTWQTLSVSGELPEGGRWLEFRVINYTAPGQATVYLDTAQLIRGQAAANVGTILGQLFDDAQTDHSADDRGTILTWLDDSGFNTTTDSAATAWASTISFAAFWGDTYLNVLRNLTRLDYEWNITPKASPTVGSTHDLNVYEPGGLGTDYSATGTPAINFGQSTTGAALVQRIPGFTAALAEGEEGIWDESEDATAQTNFGRWEEFTRSLETNSTTELNTLNTELLAFESRNRLAAKVEVVANPSHPTPLVDYTVGDKVNWQVPPTLTKEARVVQEISYRNTEPPTYQITGSQVFHRETAAWEGLRRLLEEYRHRKRVRIPKGSRLVDPFGGGGGAPTVVVAASDATEASKSRADFVCSGTNDHVEIQEAIDRLTASIGGRVLLTEGAFSCSYGQLSWSTSRVTLEGMGRNTSVLNFGTGSGAAISLASGAQYNTIANLAMLGSGAGTDDGLSVAAQRFTAKDLLIQSFGGSGIYLNAAAIALLRGLDVSSCEYAVETAAHDEVLIDHCRLQGITAAVYFNRSSYTILANSELYTNGNYALLADSVGAGTEHGPHDWVANILDGGGFSLDAQLNYLVADNIINVATQSGVLIDASYEGTFQGNQIHFATQHGFSINDTTDTVFSGNQLIQPGQGTANTYDGFLFSGNSDRNVITDNQIASDVTTTTRNGINISAATCDDNQIGSNDFGTIANFGTAVISDSGTDTQYADATTLAFSQAGALSIGAGSFKWPMPPGDYMVLDTQGAVGTAPAGGPVTLDANKNGTTMYAVATNPSIASGQTVGSAAKPDYTTLTTNDYITVDVDAANSAADLTAIVRVLPL